MKTILFTLSLICSMFTCSISFAQFNLDSICLNLRGVVKDDYDNLSSCTVNLYNGNKLEQTIITRSSGRFNFGLAKNAIYTVEFISAGYITERISVNTNMPLEKNGRLVLNIFDFDILLEPASAYDLNDEIFDFPVAIIKYEAEQESFNYSQKYLEYIKDGWKRSRNRISVSSGLVSRPRL